MRRKIHFSIRDPRGVFERAALRGAAVMCYARKIAGGALQKRAITNTLNAFGPRRFSATTLLRWVKRFRAFGLAGLLEFKRGRVGRKRGRALPAPVNPALN